MGVFKICFVSLQDLHEIMITADPCPRLSHDHFVEFQSCETLPGVQNTCSEDRGSEKCYLPMKDATS